MTTTLRNELLSIYGKYMELKMFVDSSDNELSNKYFEAVVNHHLKISNNKHHIDAGFDLFAPLQQKFTYDSINKLDYQVICSAQIIKVDGLLTESFNTGFYIYPRSSISKTNLRLANNVGIIDAGYRGHLMGMFDIKYIDETDVNKFDRYVQICAPGLIPIIVELVKTREELGDETARGSGGFGSTGN